MFPEMGGKCSVIVAPSSREVMGGLSQCGVPARTLALGYDCRALRVLAASEAYAKITSWGT